MTTITDARGALITIGDTVIYFTAGRYSGIMTARVLDVRAKVKIGNIDRPHHTSSEPDQTLWADRTSLVVVDSLPHVPGRLNTGTSA